MLNILATGAAALALISPLAAPSGPLDNPWDDPNTPPGAITIDVVTVNGSGCRPGTAAVAVSPDKQAFTVTYSEYAATVNGGAKPIDARKNCQLNLRVNVAQGFTYAIASASYRGWKDIAPKASGLQRANYYFQGDPLNGTQQHSVNAGDDNWQFDDEVPVNALVYKPCGVERNLNINTELRLNAGSSDKKVQSILAMDSTDGAITTIYHFSWLKCNKK